MNDNLTFNFPPVGNHLKYPRTRFPLEGERVSFDPPGELGGSITYEQAIIIREVLLLGCGITQASEAIGHSKSYLSQGLHFYSTWPMVFQKWLCCYLKISKHKGLSQKQKVKAFENWKKEHAEVSEPSEQEPEINGSPDTASEEFVRMQVILTKSQREWLRLKAYEEETLMTRIVRRVINEAMNGSVETLAKLTHEQAEEIKRLQAENRKQRECMQRTKHLIDVLRLEQRTMLEECTNGNNRQESDEA